MTAVAATSSAMRRALHRAETGATIDAVEAEILLQARGDDLVRLSAAAARIRDAGLEKFGRPGVITYSRKVFIPLTRLCRDRCHYCTFATTPKHLEAPFLTPDQVVEIAEAGRRAGCKEALFTLGDRPEDRWPTARRWLDEQGYPDTLSYLRAMAVLVLERTGLLPHLNPGVLSWEDLQRLKPVAPSMGMMLETTSRRLFEDPHGAHFGSPDKDPAVRLRTIEDAGRSNVPFTTGILIGIGETLADRVESLFAIRRSHRAYGAVQEVIIQNFCAKPGTAMANASSAQLDDLAATIALARVLLGPSAHIQAPPNLVGEQYRLMLSAGIDDWGGVSPVTADHVNPERPWPIIEELAAQTASAGFALRERLAVYPEYVLRGEPWLDPRVLGHVRALADPATGLAAAGAVAQGRPWQEPDTEWNSSGRTDLHVSIDETGRSADRRADFDSVYGDWDAVRERVPVRAERIDADVLGALRRAANDPSRVSDADALALVTAGGAALDAVCRFADELRRDTVGDAVTYVVNRNINFTNVCYTGCRFCAFAQRRTDADAYTLSVEEVGRRAEEAWQLGATEVCLQGGIHPDLPGTAYFDIVREIKRRVPHLHVHAFSPMEVVNGAARSGLSIREWLSEAKSAGLDSIPGTAAEILDDDVRWILTKGKLPAATWIEVVRTAHSLGIRSSSTMMYGHVDNPSHWVAHLRQLRRIQDETGGFTEFVGLPFVHLNAPLYLAGIARPGPTRDENRAIHAVARIMLHGAVDNVQCSWVKLGVQGTRALLTGGANDLGGTLMEETISRMAGSSHGSWKTVAQLREIVDGLPGRFAQQRDTVYGAAAQDRQRAAARYTGVLPGVGLDSAIVLSR